MWRQHHQRVRGNGPGAVGGAINNQVILDFPHNDLRRRERGRTTSSDHDPGAPRSLERIDEMLGWQAQGESGSK